MSEEVTPEGSVAPIYRNSEIDNTYTPDPTLEEDPAKLAAVEELIITLGISEASARAIAGLSPAE